VTRSVELTSLYDDLALSNRAPTTQVLLREEVAPPAEIVEILGVTESEPVLHIRRLRFSEGLPFAILENYLPPEFLELTTDQLERHGLYQLMRARGTTMRVARQTIGARSSSDDESRLFGQPPGSPVLTMSRTLFDQSGHPVEYGEHCYRPDLYSFEVTLVEK
jgi:DNA-binding GntR family transcriptional regulator